MQQDPFAPKYGVPVQQNTPMAPQQYAGMPVGQPKKRLNILLIPLILAVLFLLGSIGFGVWAYMGMQDYKNNVDPKIAAAVEIAKQETATQKDNEFIEKEKIPTRVYTSPQTAGSIKITYPKTWSAFVTENDKATTPVDGYFHPDFVPDIKGGTDFALRVQVSNDTYNDVLRKLEGKIKTGKVKVSAYTAPKMGANVVGSRLVGEVNNGQQNTMVVFPLRDKSVTIMTESNNFVGDFDKIVMENLTFSP